MRQEYELSFLQSVVDRYSASGPIKKHFLFESGFEDTNYFVEFNNKPYVIKIFEGADTSPDFISFEVEVMERSFRAGLKTPHVHRATGDSLVTCINDKQIILMDFIEGENMAKAPFTDGLIWETAREAGKMDTALASMSTDPRSHRDFSLDLRNFLALEADVETLPPAFDREIFRAVFDAFKKIKTTFDTLPAGVIHHDIVAHNIIAKDGHLAAIIDFSDVICAPYAQNIATSLCQTIFSYNWQPHQAAVFLKGYREFHQFSAEEEALLFDLTMTRYAALIIEFNNRNARSGEHPDRTSYLMDRYGFMQRLAEFGKAQFDTSLRLDTDVPAV